MAHTERKTIYNGNREQAHGKRAGIRKGAQTRANRRFRHENRLAIRIGRDERLVTGSTLDRVLS